MKWPSDKKVGPSFGWGLLILALLVMMDYRLALSLLATVDSVDRTGQALKTANALLAALEGPDAGGSNGIAAVVKVEIQDLRQWAAGNPERQAWLHGVERQGNLADIRKLAANIALDHKRARRAAQEMIVAAVGFGGLAIFALVLLVGSSMSANRGKARRYEAQRAIRRLSGWLLHAEDKERRRIARGLHDTMGQNLAALEISLSLVNASASSLDPKAREALSDAIAQARACSREIRSLSYLLHPPVLEAGLAAALRASAEGYAQRAGLEVRLDIPAEMGRMPLEVEIALLHFVQECLLNIHQHARSKTAEVHMAITATEILAVVSDQGRSELTPKGDVKLGVGIAGMRERARQLGGRVEIDRGEQGTTLRMILPLQGESA